MPMGVGIQPPFVRPVVHSNITKAPKAVNRAPRIKPVQNMRDYGKALSSNAQPQPPSGFGNTGDGM